MIEIKHHINEDIYILVKENNWEIYMKFGIGGKEVLITTISNASITRLIALQSILKNQEV